MTPPNGKKFDKLMRSELRKDDDDSLRTLRKLAPEVAKAVDHIDGLFADILARLQKIEDAEEAQRASPSRLMPPREPNPDEVLASMMMMTPDQRAMLMNKLKQ
jgi:hypothetical protein